MIKSCIIGATGRLGDAVCIALMEHLIVKPDDVITPINYLVFAHRYRGEDNYYEEIDVNLHEIVRRINRTKWESGDRGIVIVSSVCATDPVVDQSLSYNISKAAQLQVARYFAKTLKNVRCNTVSPAAFTGMNPKVSIQQVASVIGFLCSPESSGINGTDIRVTG